ncbi:MerR family transcriptional regulator [Anaerotignum propionicum]|uniref:MerR family transcriptional regulator n=1 Tax=Anaerotignum propionicum TaxID=28446 RepID=UPI00210DD4FA|nr:MerR family transcriptional regulator [Anaerotignum propionicum]MCQ4934857.1 MerR family transcriptional regulator [Anaerotignum propionicum]
MRNLLRIGQVSNLYGISLDTLRYYDHKNLLKPVVEKESGYRYYSLEHLDVLEMLLVGKHLEIPLEQMKVAVDSESINGYLSMLEEQHLRIEDQRKLLEKLSLYTTEMVQLLKQIQGFQTDYTFAEVKTQKNMDITIYNAELKDLFRSKEIASLHGIESFDQWFTYYVNTDGKLTENTQIVGLSLHQQPDEAGQLRNYLNSLALEGKVSLSTLSGDYKLIHFWGKESQLMTYLNTLSNHFRLVNTTIAVKFSFALLHKDMEHEYFAEIYFS